MINAGILGSTGYTGEELVRLLAGHSEVEIVFLDSRNYAGKEYTDVYPNLRKYINKKCVSVDLEKDIDRTDVVFCALPHGLSQEAVQKVMSKGKKVIDLSADFRIGNAHTYKEWYKTEHRALNELGKAVYGLSEIYADKISCAQLVANPGCYPTSSILALYPLLKEKAVGLNNIIIDSKSGVSGAGRNAADGNLYAQCNENIRAYSPGTHRHIPEIEQELTKAAGENVLIQFTPHLTPMSRGILSTIYVSNRKSLSNKDLFEIYSDYYKNKSFIRLLDEDALPQTKAVYGSNYCDIGFRADSRTGRITVISAIDNLVKGASGQAVQNMNIMFGLKETIGLEQAPIWP